MQNLEYQSRFQPGSTHGCQQKVTQALVVGCSRCKADKEGRSLINKPAHRRLAPDCRFHGKPIDPVADCAKRVSKVVAPPVAELAAPEGPRKRTRLRDKAKVPEGPELPSSGGASSSTSGAVPPVRQTPPTYGPRPRTEEPSRQAVLSQPDRELDKALAHELITEWSHQVS